MADPITFSDDDLDIATRTVDGEARGEPLEGQQAVAWVIRTRAGWQPPAWWGHSVAEVCQRHYQFSCWNGGADTDHIKALDPGGTEYSAIATVAQAVFNGEIDDPTNGATHYLVRGTSAPWLDKARSVGIQPVSIGHHDFYALGPSF